MTAHRDNSPPGFRILGGVNGVPNIAWLKCLTCRSLVPGGEEAGHRAHCARVEALLAAETPAMPATAVTVVCRYGCAPAAYVDSAHAAAAAEDHYERCHGGGAR